jgi:hypothetical protein
MSQDGGKNLCVLSIMKRAPNARQSGPSSVIDVIIDDLPTNKRAMHDIRFRFKAENIWTVISTNHPEFKPNDISKDIFLEPIVIHDLTIKTTIHHSNTVTIIVACSLNPVVADLKGLVRLSNALARVEERLRYIECAGHSCHCPLHRLVAVLPN